jgi:hypothetical protein
LPKKPKLPKTNAPVDYVHQGDEATGKAGGEETPPAKPDDRAKFGAIKSRGAVGHSLYKK